jgi:hypothetical protein
MELSIKLLPHRFDKEEPIVESLKTYCVEYKLPLMNITYYMNVDANDVAESKTVFLSQNRDAIIIAVNEILDNEKT